MYPTYLFMPFHLLIAFLILLLLVLSSPPSKLVNSDVGSLPLLCPAFRNKERLVLSGSSRGT